MNRLLLFMLILIQDVIIILFTKFIEAKENNNNQFVFKEAAIFLNYFKRRNIKISLCIKNFMYGYIISNLYLM